MAEHPELLGLATEIVSAHVSHNAIATDQLPGLIQQVFNALATVEQATTAPPKAQSAVDRKAFSYCGSYCLPGLRQALLNAEAAPDDRPQADARAVQAAMGVTTVVPFGRTQLCKDEIGTGEEDRIGSEGIGTEEDRTEGCARKTAARR